MTQLSPHHLRRKTLTHAGYALAAACWPASLTVWLLHVSHTALTDQRTLALAFTWLIATGCIGVPVAGLRLLGRHLTAGTCRAISMFCFGASALLTVLYADGQLHPTVASLYATLIMPMAVGIQAFNANRVLEREQQAYTQGRDAGQILEGKSDEELLVICDAIQAIVAARRTEARGRRDCPVRLVRDEEHGSMRRSN